MRAPRPLLAATLASLAIGLPSVSAAAAVVSSSGPVPTSALFTIPHATPDQLSAFASIEMTLRPFTEALATTRDALTLASVAQPLSDSALRAAAEKVANADLALANARLRVFNELQASPNRLDPDQAKSFIALLTNPGSANMRLAIVMGFEAYSRALHQARADAEAKAAVLKAEAIRQQALKSPPPDN